MKMKKLIKNIIYLSILFIMNLSIVYAASESDINFCSYAGVRRVFKILGLIIDIAKIIIPLILIIVGVMEVSKAIFSGKEEDLKNAIPNLMKKCIAGLVVFLLPTVLDYAFDNFTNLDKSPYAACEACLSNPNGCNVSDE